MAQNVGTFDRITRLIAALPLAVCAFVAPFTPAVRAVAFGAPALYFAATALAGVCLGYRWMGKTTCSASHARGS